MSDGHHGRHLPRQHLQTPATLSPGPRAQATPPPEQGLWQLHLDLEMPLGRRAHTSTCCSGGGGIAGARVGRAGPVTQLWEVARPGQAAGSSALPPGPDRGHLCSCGSLTLWPSRPPPCLWPLLWGFPTPGLRASCSSLGASLPARSREPGLRGPSSQHLWLPGRLSPLLLSALLFASSSKCVMSVFCAP